ncbi:MAG: T9SS type A sorting domain-containing protein [Bacteroidales bacterium]|nr:T9SS type A sorting domain-containing protein [Bacteroidales bacterium]
MKHLITIIATLIAFAAMAQNAQFSYPETYIETVLDAATLQSLSRDFSVDRVDRNADGTFNTRICLSYRDFDNFLAKNIPYTTVPQTRAYVQMAQNYEQMTASWNRYPTYSTYTAMMDTFRTRYPQLCEIDTILSNTPNHHKILCAHISNNLNNNGGKPSVFYISTIHGDEVVGYYMMLRLIDYLLTNYNTNTYVTNLVNNVDIWICPLHNPDGTYYTSNNQINSQNVSIRSNYHGVDLNRSFPWAGQNPTKENEDEPEVQAMMQFMQAHDFTLAANLHGGAEVFNYPWDYWTSWQHSHADADWWNYVGRQYADTCQHYHSTYMTEEGNGVTEGGDWYVITGSMQDYHNWYLGTRHVTIEVCDSKVLSTNYLPNYWGYAYHSLLNFIGEANHGIHGTVTDSLTGEPLEALVYIANHDLDHSYVETSLPHGDYHRPIKGGQYAVTYSAEGYLPKTIVTTVADGQRITQDVQLAKAVGLEEYESKVTVYPNPARDFVTVEMAVGTEIANIVLYDMHGRIVGTNNYSPLQPTAINVKDLPAGTYFLHILTTDNREIIRRIVHE